MVLVDLGEGVCVICLVFRVFFLKKGCVVPRPQVRPQQENKSNLCLAIFKLSLLESLSLCSVLDLSECLNGMEPPPENLQSLKLHDCRMARLPKWIKGLQNLVKLTLFDTGLSRDDAACFFFKKAAGALPFIKVKREEIHPSFTIILNRTCPV
jgi:hypothetical protein